MSMFAQLARVRATLASCKAVNLEPATFAALEEAIEELDDAMVSDIRLQAFVQSLPSVVENDPFAELEQDIACFASRHPGQELVS